MFRVRVVAPIIILVAAVLSLAAFRGAPKAQQEIIVQFQQPGLIPASTATSNPPFNSPFTESVSCPTGYVATGGGYNVGDLTQPAVQVLSSFAASSTKWQVDGVNGQSVDLPYPPIQVLCARSGP